MGEDQDAARPGCLDQADCRDCLARSGGVFKPKSPTGAGVLGSLIDDVLFVRRLPVEGLLVLVDYVVALHLGVVVGLLLVSTCNVDEDRRAVGGPV